MESRSHHPPTPIYPFNYPFTLTSPIYLHPRIKTNVTNPHYNPNSPSLPHFQKTPSFRNSILQKSMAISKLILLFSFVIWSWARVGYSQGEGEGADPMQCIQKLAPCQAYLKEASPPALCCEPLRAMVADYTQCLCAVFNNPEILKTLNVTQADGLNLAKACGSNADTSLCKTGSYFE